MTANPTDLQAAFLIAERYLAYAARSRAEIERRLTTAGFAPDTIENVVSEFIARGWLDDTEFARAWIEDRADRKQYGRMRLAAELRRRGVDSETVGEALTSIDEEDEIRRALAAASRRWTDIHSLSEAEREAQNRRLAGYLMRRGFSSGVVTKVLKELTQNSP